MTQKQTKLKNLILDYGADIIDSDVYQQSNQFTQHGSTSTRDHMISAACVSLKISRSLHLHSDEQSLVRGALLHDFFLYDWHAPKTVRPSKHPTCHSSYALESAANEFAINPLEAEIIREHMFPVTLRIPRHRETWIITIADKVCSIKETFSKPIYNNIIQELTDESR